MFKKMTFIILIIGFAPMIITSGCTLTDTLFGGFAGLCDPTTFTVTKTEDTFDAVCTPEDCSLRDAITNANDCPGHQTIELPAGTYVISITGREEDGNVTGDFDITDDLTINGSGVPTVDAGGHDRVFHTLQPATVEINGMLITGGNAQAGAGLLNETNTTLNNVHFFENSATVPAGGGGDSGGGGIYNKFRTLTLNNVRVNRNVADRGGGILNFAAATLVTNSLVIYDNRANNSGGALWNNIASISRHTDLDMFRNSAGDDGGGIYNGGGNVTITLSRFGPNDAGALGGAIYNIDGNLTIDEWTLFAENTAVRGGGLYNAGTGVVDILRTSFIDNRATVSGGAIYNEATMNLGSARLTGNQSDARGGGITNTGDLTIAATTFESNSATERGGSIVK